MTEETDAALGLIPDTEESDALNQQNQRKIVSDTHTYMDIRLLWNAVLKVRVK